MATFIKARFTSTAWGNTAGLVIDADKFRKMSLSAFSRLYPISEANKMKILQVSPEYPTWEAAFAHDFDDSQSPRTCKAHKTY